MMLIIGFVSMYAHLQLKKYLLFVFFYFCVIDFRIQNYKKPINLRIFKLFIYIYFFGIITLFILLLLIIIIFLSL